MHLHPRRERVREGGGQCTVHWCTVHSGATLSPAEHSATCTWDGVMQWDGEERKRHHRTMREWERGRGRGREEGRRTHHAWKWIHWLLVTNGASASTQMTSRVYFVIRLSSLSMNELTGERRARERGRGRERGKLSVCMQEVVCKMCLVCLARRAKEADEEKRQKGKARTTIVSHSSSGCASLCLAHCTNCPVMDMTAMSFYPTPQLYWTTRGVRRKREGESGRGKAKHTKSERRETNLGCEIHIRYYLLFICQKRYPEPREQLML